MLRNKTFLALLFLAAVSFLSFSVGGELLHAAVHHHPDQDSYDQCLMTQLQAEMLCLVAAFTLFLCAYSIIRIVPLVEVVSRPVLHGLPPLRAPPLSPSL